MTLLENIANTMKEATRLLSNIELKSGALFSVEPILYPAGQKSDMIQKTLAKLTGHPCALSAKQLLLSAENRTEHHGLVGLVHGREASFFGLRKKHHYIAFVSINLDYVQSPEESLAIFYHATSHAVDMLSLIEKDEMSLTGSDYALLPKRNQLSMARANLRADTFASFMMKHHGLDDTVGWLANKRATASVTAQTYIKPEDFPFAIAIDVAKLASEKSLDYKQNKIEKYHDLAKRVTQTFDKNSVAAWIGFTAPAQNLAWSGYNEASILHLAINTSPNPLIKANGHLVADITNIRPHISPDLYEEGYNPFVSREFNRDQHLRKAEEHFEIALVHALEAESAEPFIRSAHKQNEALLKGRVVGWCAHALQAAGNAFTVAQERGNSLDQATRMIFDGRKALPEWNELQDMNNFVMAQRRQGFGITMNDLSSWCKRHTGMNAVIESLENTMRDPVYGQKLALATEMPAPGPRMAAQMDHYFAPKGPTPVAPSAQIMMVPSIGGAMGATVQRPVAVQRNPIEIETDE
jgi:hypothetical protein